MMRDTGRNVVRRLGLAAAAIMMLTALPGQRAQAMSPISPGVMPSAHTAAETPIIQVRGPHGGGGGGFHGGGGGGFHGGGGGGFHGGGAAFHAAPAFHGGGGSGFRAGPAFHGGGGAAFHGGGFRAGPTYQGAGVRYGGYHPGFASRPHFHHRQFYGYGPSYYPVTTAYYYPYRRCRVILTYYGPRRICHYRHWHRPHHRHHRHYRYW
jgi:hypothetical protein